VCVHVYVLCTFFCIVCMCTYVLTCIYVCICMYACMDWAHAPSIAIRFETLAVFLRCVCVYICMHASVMCVYRHSVFLSGVCIHMYVCTSLCIVCMSTYVHTCIYVCIRIRPRMEKSHCKRQELTICLLH